MPIPEATRTAGSGGSIRPDQPSATGGSGTAPGASSSALPYACDLVMKGGITSGIVYPEAVAELARDHRLHNIGGSSAGAIGAVAAAAAEYGRQSGTFTTAQDQRGAAVVSGAQNPNPPFDYLAGLPGLLAETDTSGRTLLERLFVPQAETKTYFTLFWNARKGRRASLVAMLAKRGVSTSLARGAPGIVAGLCSAVLFALAVLLASGGAGLPVWARPVFALLVAANGFVVLLVAGVLKLVSAGPLALAANMHGICNGSSEGTQVGLTDWLHQQIQRLAGRDPVATDGKPLTYGDLRTHEIGLVTLTTNLSQNSSETFPFDDNTWAFDSAVITRLFPRAVAKQLIDAGKEATELSSKRVQLEKQGLLKLPPADQLPVVFGARISLSFPILLSAVPLWRLVPERRSGTWTTEYHEVWLSDGGICSNMPVHLFDSPLPTRPTYGINLATGGSRPENPGDGDHDHGLAREALQNVWRPVHMGAGGQTRPSAITSTIGLLGEVLNTMQNWSDNSLTKALGVRDRICTVRLGAGEGGMNLDMSPATIEALAPRGRAAGQNLGWMVRGQAPEGSDPGLDKLEAANQWTRHRWTRMRSTALAAHRYAAEIADKLTAEPIPQGPVDTSSSSGVVGARVASEADNSDAAEGEISGSLTRSDRGRQNYEQLAVAAVGLDFLPYQNSWSAAAAENLVNGLQRLADLDFESAATVSAPPYRRLILDPRTEPESMV